MAEKTKELVKRKNQTGVSRREFMGTTAKVWRKSMSGPYQSHVQMVIAVQWVFDEVHIFCSRSISERLDWTAP